MLKRLKQILFSDFGPAPQPDLSTVPKFSSEVVMETVYEEGSGKRAFILKDEKGIFHTYIEWWDTSDWDAGYGARWTGGYTGGLSDSLERAREIASEELRRFSTL